MRYSLLAFAILLSIIITGCTSGPPESPDGKYGDKAVAKERAMDFTELGPKRGQYINQEIIILRLVTRHFKVGYITIQTPLLLVVRQK